MAIDTKPGFKTPTQVTSRPVGVQPVPPKPIHLIANPRVAPTKPFVTGWYILKNKTTKVRTTAHETAAPNATTYAYYPNPFLTQKDAEFYANSHPTVP